jgi:hypothetical protein
MGIVSNFSERDVNNFMKDFLKRKEVDFIRVLKFVGERAVNEARASGSYNDQTANLRNSTGFVIVVNGSVVSEDFSSSTNGKEKTTLNAKTIGRTLAYDLASGYKDVALIVVAGMNYAAYVESRGYNVLTSAEQLANVQVPLLLNQLR